MPLITSQGDSVGTFCLAEWVVLKVADDSIGMDPADVPDLFEPFSKTSTGFARTHEGSGLGLAVAQRLVDQMGGPISVETTEGKGTCMTVRFPRPEEQ